MAKLKWVRLANGWHYNPEHHIQVGRSMQSAPVRIRVPIERDDNGRDGWAWTDVVDSITHTDAHFGNIPSAKEWVAFHLDDVVLDQASEKDNYDGDPVAAAEREMAQHEEWRARSLPQREATTPAPQARPNADQCFHLGRANDHCMKNAVITIDVGYDGLGACGDHITPVLLWAMGKNGRGELPDHSVQVYPAWSYQELKGSD